MHTHPRFTLRATTACLLAVALAAASWGVTAPAAGDEDGACLRFGPLAVRGPATLAPVSVPRAFDAIQIGVVPAPAADLRIRVRGFAPGRGPTTRWYEVRQETEVLLDAPAVGLQLSVDSDRPARLGSVVVHTATRRAPRVPRSNAHFVNVPRPPIKLRADWGARPATAPYDPNVPSLITVHHTSQPTAADYHGATTIRGIQDFHMDSHGWIDIGYHYLIGPDGAIYEGRPEATLGAHSPPNPGKLGVCLIGDFQGAEHPTPAAVQALTALLAHLTGKYAIEGRAIFGHRDFNETDCCGDLLYAQLPALRDAVTKQLAYYTAHPIPLPTPSPSPAP